MVTSGIIDRFHEDVQVRIASVVDQPLVIKPRVNNWQGVAAKTTIAFDMFSDAKDFAERKRGGRCPVFPLSRSADESENHAWAGWHEEWRCERTRQYDLVGAGWTFFWGIFGRLSKEQEIFRAEWDETAYRGGFAPQPHWHVDTGIMVGYTARPAIRVVSTADSASLVEIPASPRSALSEILPAEGVQELSLAGMHLGMGGWLNHTKHPEWWQCHVGEQLDPLVDWAERTLRSMIDQFGELRVEAIIEQ